MLESGFNAGLLVSAPRSKWKKGSNSGLWVWLEEASVQDCGVGSGGTWLKVWRARAQCI